MNKLSVFFYSSDAQLALSYSVILEVFFWIFFFLMSLFMIASSLPPTLLGVLSVEPIREQIFAALPPDNWVDLSRANKACCRYYREQYWLQQNPENAEVSFATPLLKLLHDHNPEKQKEGWQWVHRLITRALSFTLNERPFDEILKLTLDSTCLPDWLPPVNQAEATFNIASAYHKIFDTFKDLFKYFSSVFCGADSALSGLGLNIDDEENVNLRGEYSATHISNANKRKDDVKTAIKDFMTSIEESKSRLKTDVFWRLFIELFAIAALASTEQNWFTLTTLTGVAGLLPGQLEGCYKLYQAFNKLRAVSNLEDFEKRLDDIQPLMINLLKHEHQLKIKISEGRKLNAELIAPPIETEERRIAIHCHEKEQNQQLQEIAKKVGKLQEKLQALFPRVVVTNRTLLNDFA